MQPTHLTAHEVNVLTSVMERARLAGWSITARQIEPIIAAHSEPPVCAFVIPLYPSNVNCNRLRGHYGNHEWADAATGVTVFWPND